MRRPLVLLAIALATCGDDGRDRAPAPEPAGFSFAVLTDLHIGEGVGVYAGQDLESVARARAAVEKINALAASEDLKFVFVLGDLTDSAEPAEFAKVREILDLLEVPYFPLLGNHDVWPYSSETEAPAPTGDAIFEETFGDRLAGLEHPGGPVWNPEEQCWSRFQNFELRRQGVVFLGLDWNSRQHAPAGYKGAAPEADLHDFPGGAFPWLVARLAALPSDTKRVVLLQHHPFRPPAPLPDWMFAFSGSEKAMLLQALLAAAPAATYSGVFAGHFHRFATVPAFDEWPDFTQWETDACKESAAVALVRVSPDGSIQVAAAP